MLCECSWHACNLAGISITSAIPSICELRYENDTKLGNACWNWVPSVAYEQSAANKANTCCCAAHLQNRVGSVGTDDGDDMQLFSGLSPQGLQGVHGTAVSLHPVPTCIQYPHASSTHMHQLTTTLTNPMQLYGSLQFAAVHMTEDVAVHMAPRCEGMTQRQHIKVYSTATLLHHS